MGDEDKFDICGSCEYRGSQVCDLCDEGSHYEEAYVDELSQSKRIPILEAA